MNETKGRCLCGAVQFVVKGLLFGICQCHCSQCRMITGSSANASCVVPANQFTWIKGESNVKSYIHESGYRSSFCATCGSPMPNIMKNNSNYWIPVGVLQDKGHLKVKAHLCVASKASWDTAFTEGKKYSDVPEFNELMATLRESD
jgi:hypothetical protein